MKSLIINLDDFGLSKGINAGIVKSLREGIATSVSVAANGSAYDEAVAFLKENRKIDVGIHLVLTQEKGVLDGREIPGLVDRKGYFSKNWFHFLFRFYSGRIEIKEIEKEFNAQITKILESGIELSHIDSHGYIHLFPPITDLVIKLAKHYGIKMVRMPFEDLTCQNYFSIIKSTKVLVLFCLAYLGKKKIEKHGLKCVDRMVGIYNSGELNFKNFCEIIKKIKNSSFNIFELVCHPGISITRPEYMQWNYHWDDETRLLTSREAERLLTGANIKLVNYRSILEIV